MKLLEVEEHRYNFHRTWRLFAYPDKEGAVITAVPIIPLDRSGIRHRRYFNTRQDCLVFLEGRQKVFDECIRVNPAWWSPGAQYRFIKRAIKILTDL